VTTVDSKSLHVNVNQAKWSIVSFCILKRNPSVTCIFCLFVLIELNNICLKQDKAILSYSGEISLFLMMRNQQSEEATEELAKFRVEEIQLNRMFKNG